MRREAYPRIVRRRICAGARKWNWPLSGLVRVPLRRKRSYFIFCRTMPPEMLISSQRTTACDPARVSVAAETASKVSLRESQSCTQCIGRAPCQALAALPCESLFACNMASFSACSGAEQAHHMVASQRLLGDDRSQAAEHVRPRVDDDLLHGRHARFGCCERPGRWQAEKRASRAGRTFMVADRARATEPPREAGVRCSRAFRQRA